MKTTLGIVFIAIGLFSSLSALRILRPYKTKPDMWQHIDDNRFAYLIGGLLIIAYGIYKFV
jgi:hypothetical protein